MSASAATTTATSSKPSPPPIQTNRTRSDDSLTVPTIPSVSTRSPRSSTPPPSARLPPAFSVAPKQRRLLTLDENQPNGHEQQQQQQQRFSYLQQSGSMGGGEEYGGGSPVRESFYGGNGRSGRGSVAGLPPHTTHHHHPHHPPQPLNTSASSLELRTLFDTSYTFPARRPSLSSNHSTRSYQPHRPSDVSIHRPSDASLSGESVKMKGGGRFSRAIRSSILSAGFERPNSRASQATLREEEEGDSGSVLDLGKIKEKDKEKRVSGGSGGGKRFSKVLKWTKSVLRLKTKDSSGGSDGASVVGVEVGEGRVGRWGLSSGGGGGGGGETGSIYEQRPRRGGGGGGGGSSSPIPPVPPIPVMAQSLLPPPRRSSKPTLEFRGDMGTLNKAEQRSQSRDRPSRNLDLSSNSSSSSPHHYTRRTSSTPTPSLTTSMTTTSPTPTSPTTPTYGTLNGGTTSPIPSIRGDEIPPVIMSTTSLRPRQIYIPPRDPANIRPGTIIHTASRSQSRGRYGEEEDCERTPTDARVPILPNGERFLAVGSSPFQGGTIVSVDRERHLHMRSGSGVSERERERSGERVTSPSSSLPTHPTRSTSDTVVVSPPPSSSSSLRSVRLSGERSRDGVGEERGLLPWELGNNERMLGSLHRRGNSTGETNTTLPRGRTLGISSPRVPPPTASNTNLPPSVRATSPMITITPKGEVRRGSCDAVAGRKGVRVVQEGKGEGRRDSFGGFGRVGEGKGIMGRVVVGVEVAGA
ncbi:hypothetical protein HDV00_008683 [Rhizophlyctis rosea]|nr:hypothetical protein HDV00_008683 [Rhizophlyctis rosea]